MVFGLLIFLSVIISGCAQDIPSVLCHDPDFQCYMNQSMRNLSVVRENIGYWSTLNIVTQVLVAVMGIISTMVIALQGDENKHWTRPVGIVATALVTGLSSALVSFHVPESIDKLIDIAGEITVSLNNFDYQVERLKAGRSSQQVEAAYKSDAEFREAVNSLTQNFANSQNKIKMEMLRIRGTAARLNPAPAKAQPEKRSHWLGQENTS